ncbi:hypothetical protein EMMF5_003595 [Cystobasidiomycetes sp. EMM_F5]
MLHSEDGRKAGALLRARMRKASQLSRHAQEIPAQTSSVAAQPANEIEQLRRRNVQLRSSVLALEQALLRNGVSITEALADSPETLGAETTSATDDDVDEVEDLERLQLDGVFSATLNHFGPTSAFQYLTTTSAEATSGVQTSASGVSADTMWMVAPQCDAWSRHLPSLGISRRTHDILLEFAEAFFTPWCWVD